MKTNKLNIKNTNKNRTEHSNMNAAQYIRYWICIYSLNLVNIDKYPTYKKTMKQLCLSNQAFLPFWPKYQGKILLSWEQKELLRSNKKHFSSILKDFHWSKWNKFLGRWESNSKSTSNSIRYKYYKMLID